MTGVSKRIGVPRSRYKFVGGGPEHSHVQYGEDGLVRQGQAPVTSGGPQFTAGAKELGRLKSQREERHRLPISALPASSGRQGSAAGHRPSALARVANRKTDGSGRAGPDLVAHEQRW